MNPFLLLLALAALSLGLRTFDRPALRKLGAAGLLAAVFLAVWFFTGSLILSALACTSWLLVPWLEIFLRVRHLRLPVEKTLRYRTAPSQDDFPDLDDLTSEIEDLGFLRVTDTGWEWDGLNQFLRLFHHPGQRLQASICLNHQHDLTFFYISVSARDLQGRLWTTWNYPFSHGLRVPPEWRIHRDLGSRSFAEMCDSHRDLLRSAGILRERLNPLDPETLTEIVENDLKRQIGHNLDTGFLTLAADGPPGHLRYSWKGLLYLWGQSVKDLVRLS